MHLQRLKGNGNVFSKVYSIYWSNIPYLLIIFSSLSFATEDFEARSLSTINSCSCSSEAIPITIRNTGYAKQITYEINGESKTTVAPVGLQSTYYFSVSGSAAEYFELQYPLVNLSSGEELTYYGYLNAPCDVDGRFDLVIDISTGSGPP